jgi:hypothetical protein
MKPLFAGWRRQRRIHAFVNNCTAHFRDGTVREEVRSGILQAVRHARAEGLEPDLDPRFRLRVEKEDLTGGRLDLILRRLSGLRYLDDIRFQEGLERRLVASHQIDGQRFLWKRLPRRTPVYIRLTDARIGFGLFADRDLVEGEFVGEYAGSVSLSDSVADKAYCYAYHSLQVGGEETRLTIDARLFGNETRFINHARPEVLSHVDEFFNGHWHVMFSVSCPVAKGEQLLIDYGDPYWEGKPEPPDPLSP